jgi:hypothetical protein
MEMSEVNTVEIKLGLRIKPPSHPISRSTVSNLILSVSID